MEQVKISVKGKVQGVWFRASAQEQAKALGLSAHAKNNPDGSVTVTAQGQRANLRKLIEWCSHGPPNARVDELSTEWEAPAHPFDQFDLG